MPKGRKKSQHKTLRLGEREKFAVDFWAQKLGMSGNAFIGIAAEAYANHLSAEHELAWDKIWHPEESVRELRKLLLDDAVFKFSDAEGKTRAFVLHHAPFFFDEQQNGRLTVNVGNALELYPRMREWLTTKGDHWAPGRAMAEHLKSRGLEPPAWPPKKERA